MIFIGIDPGMSGAVAQIDSDGSITFADMPFLTVKTGARFKHVPDVVQMVNILFWASKGIDPFVTIESVHAMPGEGAVGAFSFGMGFGMWQGILAALMIPYQLVTPQEWKKTMLAGACKEKDASRQKAMQLFPKTAEHLQLKKHHGRADALLMAEYARRTHKSTR